MANNWDLQAFHGTRSQFTNSSGRTTNMRTKWFIVGAATASLVWWLALSNVGAGLLAKLLGGG